MTLISIAGINIAESEKDGVPQIGLESHFIKDTQERPMDILIFEQKPEGMSQIFILWKCVPDSGNRHIQRSNSCLS